MESITARARNLRLQVPRLNSKVRRFAVGFFQLGPVARWIAFVCCDRTPANTSLFGTTEELRLNSQVDLEKPTWNLAKFGIQIRAVRL
jgi:hypothetical protein